MEIKVPSYTDPYAFCSALVKEYSLEEKPSWNSNILTLPQDLGIGKIQLFIHKDIHFYKANYAFAQPSYFYAEDNVRQNNLIDFRINTPGVINSAQIEGEKRFEWEITHVDGFRVFIPETYFSCPKSKLLHKVEKYCFDKNILSLQKNIIALSPQTPNDSLLLESRFLEFTYYLLDFLNNKEILVHFEGLSPYQLQCIYDAKSILDNNLHSTPTIVELSRKVGLNTDILKRGFRLVTDMPIRQYLIKSKMAYIHEMLTQTEKPIGEICQLLGYTNRSHFAQMYKKYYGNLPLEDRMLKNDAFLLEP